MKVNSSQEFRLWRKETSYRPEVDENFMGCIYKDRENTQLGFFNLYHGDKENIETYLPSVLDIAEDNQAIYEFLQNAVDCGSTHFYAFYNFQVIVSN